MLPVKARKQSDLIRLLPASNLHHGIRQAARLGLDLNLFVSINFSLTSCVAEETDRSFAGIRAKFGKWVQHPRKDALGHEAPPTFVWVLENPDNCMNAHWLVHVPLARQQEFSAKLDKWLNAATGGVHSDKAIHVRSAPTPTAAEKYMLKGMHPSLAKVFRIQYENQGWVTGKRVGHSLNVGPGRRVEMRELGIYPPARKWVPWPLAKYCNGWE
jgi:hypothetical protein